MARTRRCKEGPGCVGREVTVKPRAATPILQNKPWATRDMLGFMKDAERFYRAAKEDNPDDLK